MIRNIALFVFAGLMLLLLIALLGLMVPSAHGQTAQDLGRQFPDNPLPQYDSKSQSYSFEPKVERAVNKKFIVAHAIYLGAAVYDSEVTRRGLKIGKCAEKNFGSNGPEIYAKNLGFWAGVTLADYGLRKIKVPLMPYLMPGYPTFVHLRGGTEWFTMGCM